MAFTGECEWYLLPRWPATWASYPASSAFESSLLVCFVVCNQDKAQSAHTGLFLGLSYPHPLLIACAGSVLCKGTRRLDHVVWDISFFLLVAGLCFSSWGLSAQTGFCSVLAQCPCPSWAGCAALAGADSQAMCSLQRCGTSADGAFLSQTRGCTQGFVCFVHHCRKGSANPSGGERVICSDVNLEVKVRSGIPCSSSPLLAESCHGLV